MSERSPNLFVIGAMKSGTTSLHVHLNAHPDIYMSRIKEPGYFVEELSLDKGRDWYLGLFSGASNELYIGESSTHYTKLPTYTGVPERISRFCEKPRFIYVMRDPIDRTISHYWHSVRKEGEHRSMLAAIKANNKYIDFSYYAMQLKPYIQRFGLESIHVLTFESLVCNPETALQSLLAWLHLDYNLLEENLNKQYNKLPEKFERASGLGILYQFRHSSSWAALSRLTPKIVRTWGASLSAKEAARDNKSVPDVTRYLHELQKARVNELSALLDREFPEWSTTMGAGQKIK